MPVVCSQLPVDGFKGFVMRKLIFETPVKYVLHFIRQARKATNYGAINILFNYEYNITQSQVGPYKIAK
jgi:hypothetical protein